jgi:SAM-dependent methyltransferase
MSDRTGESFGIQGTTFVDRLGVWLSQSAIRRAIKNRKNIDALELGCGYRATQLVALKDHLRKGVGVDFKIAPELHSAAGLQFHECEIEAALARLEKQSFDLILMISVLEHLKNAGQVLQEAHQLLRPKGVLLINVPTWRGKFFLEFSAFRLGLSPRVEMDDHKMYYDKRDLWPLLVQAGFKPSKITMRSHKLGLNLFSAAFRADTNY